MGWASGSDLFSQIIAVIKEEVPDIEKRKTIYRTIARSFEDFDWDTQDECLGEDPAYDAVYDE